MPTTSYDDFTAGVRAIGARTDNAGSAATDLAADEDRLINHILTEGYLTTDAFVVAADSPASMDVIVGSGTAKADLYVVEGDDDGQHPYLVRLDDASITVTLDAADASNPRIDEIWLVVADATWDSGSVSLPRIGYRKGDAAASPSAPGADASWKAAVKLATVTVGASATSVGTGDVADNRTEAVPAYGHVGEVKMTAAAGTPTGWLECNGSAVSRTTYARLFAAIGTTFGSGDGSTTFNVPDLRDRFPVGAGSSYARGATGGAAEHTLTSAEMPTHTHTGPSHTHAFSDTSSSSGAHTHTTDSIDQDSGATGTRVLLDDGNPGATVHEIASVNSSGAHTHTVSGTTGSGGTGGTGSAGSGDAHENRPPYLGLRFIIFAAA